MDEFDKLFNGDLNDEQFREEFIKLINLHKQSMDKFMKSFYDDSFFTTKPFIGFFMDNTPNPNEFKTEFGVDDFGNWEKREWSSEDGSTKITSFNRHFNIEPEQQREEPLDLLRYKMKLAVEKENYEEAAKYRDAIKAIEEKNKK
jgi:hypothetical protein